jgi:choline dehydrogenase-like flavoprotein
MRQQDSQPFDYIAIGAGAAGSVLAARLAQANKSVFLLRVVFYTWYVNF